MDATIIPFLEQRVNSSLGCYGCREATDVRPSEAVCGLPGCLLDPLLEELESLAAVVMPRSRAKKAFYSLECQFADAEAVASPFDPPQEGQH